MNKSFTILLSIVLFCLLGLMSILLFAFSQTGNEMLKPYVQQRLEEKIGMPVEVGMFKLGSGRSSVDMVINRQAAASVEVYYDLWGRSFEGSYHIKADRLNYENIKLKDADVKGNFKGVSENIHIDGKGSALGAALEYSLNLIDDLPRKIVVNVQGAQLAEVLQLLGHPAWAEGKIDVEINMPDIGKETANGYGHIVLKKAYFDRVLVKEMYGYTLPEKSHLYGRMDASLEDKKIKLAGDIQSNLFALQIKEALADLASDQLRAAYTFDVKDMRILTKKKLTGGALSMNAEVESSGKFKEGKGYIDTKLKSSLGDMVLDDMVYDVSKNTLQSAYTVDIPSLKELQPLIDSQLYGSLLLKGQLSKEQVLNVTGSTQSLGGNINYTLVGDDLSSTLRSVPLETMLVALGHKKNFLGSASGEARYNLKGKSGAVDLDIASFQIKPSNLTSVISMAIGKDPARVIYSSTKFHADIKGEITDYTLHATGSSSSIDITEGRLNRLNNTNSANFTFVYEKYTINGKIQGSVDNPKVTLDTSSLFQDKMDEKMQKKIDKAFGGKAGELLKGLPF